MNLVGPVPGQYQLRELGEVKVHPAVAEAVLLQSEPVRDVVLADTPTNVRDGNRLLKLGLVQGVVAGARATPRQHDVRRDGALGENRAILGAVDARDGRVFGG